MAARWPDHTPPAAPAAVAVRAAAGCTDAFLDDLTPAPDLPVDPGEAFAAFAACPPVQAPVLIRTDPETRGEQLRDDPVDDWHLDRWQDRYDNRIYGEHR